MDLPQLGPRIGAQLLGEPPAELLVRGQCLRLAPGGVEGPDPQAVQPLPQRVAGRELLELGHQRGVPAAAQLRLHPVLGRGEPGLLQPGRVRHGERGRGDLAQGGSPPEAECLAQQVRGGHRIPVPQGSAPLAGQPLEPVGVDGVRRHVEQVPPVVGAQRRRAGQDAAQPGHQRLDRVRRIPRPAVGPERVRQLLDRDDAPGTEGEPDQQHAKPRPPDLDDLAGGHDP
ncbi:hypothetical protein GCM10018952_23470 [Streptosporangium vulgare]